MGNLLRSLLNKYRLQIGVFLIAAVVTGGGVLALTTGRSKPPEIEKVGKIESAVEVTDSNATISPLPKIKVDVAGAVVNPGVYEILNDGRVEEALDAAGGMAEEADRDWVSKNLNLAAKLSDGDKLYIPRVAEVEAVSPAAGIVSGVETPSGGESSNCSGVNINTASVATLDDCLSGIGPAYAQRIVEYRESHGGFKSIGEIQEVRGIGPKTFEKLKDQITVD